MKRVFVTGGAGFIGRNVIRELLTQVGCRVTVYDLNPPTGLDVDFIRGSVEDAELVVTAMADHDVVVHLAAKLGVSACQQDETEVFSVNEQGTLNVLTAMAQHGIRRLLFSSSSEVYGDGVTKSFIETDHPQPKSAYGRSKLEGERLVRQFTECSGITATVTRLFNVYGPGQRNEFVVSRFCHRAIRGEPLEIYGSGRQTRTFTYIDDAARGIVAALRATQLTNFEIFNIGSNDTITVASLARLILSVANSQSELVSVPLSSSGIGRNANQEVFHRKPDITKAAESLLFSSTTPLAEGIVYTVQWCSLSSPQPSCAL